MSAPRDWDQELAKIDRLMAERPGPPVGVEGTTAPHRRRAAPGGPTSRGATVGVWLRVLLAAAAGIATTQWPFAYSCGVPLFFYLCATALVTLAGIWAAVGTWRHQRPVAHVIALATMAWGLVLAGAAVLPRVGYAREAATWLCP